MQAVEKAQLLNTCKSLKDEFDYLSFVAAVDKTDSIEVIYQLFSTKTNQQASLKVVLDRNNPEIDSVSSIWKAADWHERETYDLFGVKFRNHPNLQRILTAENFEGFPFRKDFTHPDLIRMPNV